MNGGSGIGWRLPGLAQVDLWTPVLDPLVVVAVVVVVVVVGRGPGHQFVHPMKRGKRGRQQLAVLTALSQLALYDDEVDVVVVCRQGGLRRQDLA